MKAYIFDLDGTACNIDHRLHLIQGPADKSLMQNRNDQDQATIFRPDWDAFFRACPQDGPIWPICHLAHSLMLREYVLFVTGRSDMVRDLTMAWLNRNVAAPAILSQRSRLYMRKHGDHRQDHVVKLEMLAQIKKDGFEPIMAFESHGPATAMWRAQGIVCAQVAPGNF